jgi:uncharacterized protein (TIGR03118 family)
MLKINPFSRLAAVASALALAIAPACLHADSFTQTNLVSDVNGLAANTDPNLKNPWGVAFSATSPFWASDQATGVATLYNGAGVPQALVVTIPGAAAPPSGPTGQVFNAAASGFAVGSAKATFIFDTLNGTIAAWNAGAGTTAVPMASTPGAVYTGLAQGSNAAGTFLYAANSAGTTGGIDVFDSSWHAATLSGTFTDPNLPAGFVPFNIQNLNGNLYVTYTGASGGIVDEFDTNGNFIGRIATNGPLDAPWGIVFAPSGFGAYSNDLLIGNFGNGEIDVYDPTTYMFLGTLDGSNGMPLVNGALWALETRAPGGTFNPDAVYFTAGINGQEDGLFGEITANTPEPSTIVGTATGLIALALTGLRRRFSGI